MLTRLIPLASIENLRDYGGYASSLGGQVISGHLFRSGHQARANDADLKTLQGLDLTHIVDLRRPSERQVQPCLRYAPLKADVIVSDLNDEGEAPHITFLKTTDLTPPSVREFMVSTYQRLPFDPRHLDLFSRYFQVMAQAPRHVTRPDQASIIHRLLIHCAAGKDRTGILAALTHTLLGVHHDDLMADYLLTNHAVALEKRSAEVANTLEKTYGRRPSLEATRAFLGVEPEFLTASFAAIRDQFGSVIDYLEQGLGLTVAQQDQIRANYLT